MKAREASIPRSVRKLPVGERIRWARKRAGLSHDQLVAKLGRSNRGHLIKIEQGVHAPRPDLRHAIADATDVPPDLFADEDDEESDPVRHLMNALRLAVRAELAKERA